MSGYSTIVRFRKLIILTPMLLLISRTIADDCANCGSTLHGLPVASAVLQKVAEEAAKGDRKYKPITNEDFTKLCQNFLLSEDDPNLRSFFHELKKSSIDPVEAFTKIGCIPQNSVSENVKIPFIQYIPPFIDEAENYIKKIFSFFIKEEQNPEAWKRIINTQNSNKMTLLDMIEYQKKVVKVDAKTEKKLNDLRKFLCGNGGEFSHYKGEKC